MIGYIPLAITAYVLNGLAILVNKHLLATAIPKPLAYVFYVTLTSFVGLLALPWSHRPDLAGFALASLSSLSWTAGAYFLYAALDVGSAVRVAPVIDTILPVLLLAFDLLVQHAVAAHQAAGAAICILGLVVITAPLWRTPSAAAGDAARPHEFVFEFLSAVFFAASYLLLRSFYAHSDFVTWIAWSRLVLIPLVLLLVLLPVPRTTVLSGGERPLALTRRAGALFLGGQAAGGLGQVLQTFAISLAAPALVTALQGSEYIFLFVASLVLTLTMPDTYREHFAPGSLLEKLAGVLIIGLGLFVLA